MNTGSVSIYKDCFFLRRLHFCELCYCRPHCFEFWDFQVNGLWRWWEEEDSFLVYTRLTLCVSSVVEALCESLLLECVNFPFMVMNTTSYKLTWSDLCIQQTAESTNAFMWTISLVFHFLKYPLSVHKHASTNPRKLSYFDNTISNSPLTTREKNCTSFKTGRLLTASDGSMFGSSSDKFKRVTCSSASYIHSYSWHYLPSSRRAAPKHR